MLPDPSMPGTCPALISYLHHQPAVWTLHGCGPSFLHAHKSNDFHLGAKDRAEYLQKHGSTGLEALEAHLAFLRRGPKGKDEACLFPDYPEIPFLLPFRVLRDFLWDVPRSCAKGSLMERFLCFHRNCPRADQGGSGGDDNVFRRRLQSPGYRSASIWYPAVFRDGSWSLATTVQHQRIAYFLNRNAKSDLFVQLKFHGVVYVFILPFENAQRLVAHMESRRKQ